MSRKWKWKNNLINEITKQIKDSRRDYKMQQYKQYKIYWTAINQKFNLDSYIMKFSTNYNKWREIDFEKFGTH